MKTITVTELQQQTINSLIDDNIRFNITHEELDSNEEERIENVANKVAILREQFLRDNK